MEFAKYYEVTNRVNNLVKEGELHSYEVDYYKGVFVCEDTHDIWVVRILEGYNKNYDKEEGTWLIERNKIDKYILCDFLKESNNDNSETTGRHTRDYYINECFELEEVLSAIIKVDDEQGLENWDSFECVSYEDCITLIDGGYGIIKE